MKKLNRRAVRYDRSMARAKKAVPKAPPSPIPDDVWIGIKYEPNEWHGGLVSWSQVDEAWERRVAGSNYDAATALRAPQWTASG